MGDYREMPLTDIVKLEGVKDLPTMQARGNFAAALKAEALGDVAKANKHLEIACNS